MVLGLVLASITTSVTARLQGELAHSSATVQLWPPSLLLAIPLVVAAYTIWGLLGSTAIRPIRWRWKGQPGSVAQPAGSSVQLAPPLVVFHTPPVAAPR